MFNTCRIAGFAILLGLVSSAAHADYFQLTSLTPGTSGSFQGTLSGVMVQGSITSSPGGIFQINGTSGTNAWEVSNTTNTSPQYSYSDLYFDPTPHTYEIGVTKFQGTHTSTMKISFASPMTDVVLQLANMDNSQWSLSHTAGLTGLTILKGNGGGGDGLGISGDTIIDLNPSTAVGLSQATDPPTSGGRSAYGSVLLDGTYSDIIIDVQNAPGAGVGDGLNFTLVSTPEPTSIALLVLIAGWFANTLRSRRKA